MLTIQMNFLRRKQKDTSLSVMVTGAGSVVCLRTVVLLLTDVDGATAGVEAAAGTFFIIITPLAALDTDDCVESRLMNERKGHIQDGISFMW